MSSTLEKKKDTDLLKDLSEKRGELRDLRLGKKALPHARYERQVRQDIARIMTELSRRTA